MSIGSPAAEHGGIVVRGLGKRFGPRQAVDGVSFTVEPGRVTGFLGPNGAGKTTTLRMIVGLVTPTAGSATICGRSYRDLPVPARTVGALLDATGFDPGRTGRNHLRVYAPAAGVDDRRIDEVLDLVGLTDAAGQCVRGYSLGMRQRLALATALLADPQILICDEPANGLDPDGIRWLRGVLRGHAARGRAVLVSSHLLAEMQQTVDDVVILHRGRIVYHGVAGQGHGDESIRVRSPEHGALAAALRAELPPDGAITVVAPDWLVVRGLSAESVGRAAAGIGIVILEMTSERPNLEHLFLSLTSGDRAGTSLQEEISA